MQCIDRLDKIVVGRQKDNMTEEIRFDVGPWRDRWPFLTIWHIEVVRKDGKAYIPANVVLEGDVLTWTITANDTQVVGMGEYAIVATGENGERKSSAVCTMVVKESMGEFTGEELPDPMEPYVDKVAQAAQRAEEAAKRAEEAAGSAGGGGITEIPVASDKELGGIKVGKNLVIDESGVLSVDTAGDVEEDNTKPITSAAVHTTLGNIEILLGTI